MNDYTQNQKDALFFLEVLNEAQELERMVEDRAACGASPTDSLERARRKALEKLGWFLRPQRGMMKD